MAISVIALLILMAADLQPDHGKSSGPPGGQLLGFARQTAGAQVDQIA